MKVRNDIAVGQYQTTHESNFAKTIAHPKVLQRLVPDSVYANPKIFFSGHQMQSIPQMLMVTDGGSINK